MPWVYNSSNGTLAHNGEVVTAGGWAGHDAGYNNPAMEMDHNIGPIPRGDWFIGDAIESQHLGPIALPLVPQDGTETFGRGGFFIHGASGLHPDESSHGCVILPRTVRAQIAASDDRILQVV